VKKIRIAYITESSPNDKHAWSGTAHYVYKTLVQSGFDVHALGPARPLVARLLLAASNKISIYLFGKRLDYRHSIIYARAFGRLFSHKLNRTPHDLVVLCGATECGAYLTTIKPKVYILDRTIAGAVNYHTILSNLWPFSERQSILTDKKAMEESSMLFFSSPWAANHATMIYKIPPEKIKVLPFGANLDQVPDRATALQAKTQGSCNLLLIGTYWKNKGADIAYNTLLLLLKNNVNARLTVAGCSPPESIQNERLTVIPFIDKNSVDGLKQLWQLFVDHHFFILPTRFDCTPIVFCEASAFGLPSLSANTGGVAGHIKEGVNGFLIPYEDNGEGYAKKIMSLLEKPEEYRNLCVSTRDHYEKALNWESWAHDFKNFVKELI
jgi:glycosyltransferase involved in cell wall biosynthesis